jgi:hypothetical protein
MADCILLAVARKDTFFTQKTDALGNSGICQKVKLLMGLKCIAYGVSPSTFQDYFQMGEMTGHDCVKRLASGISTSKELRSVFLHSMTRADAMRVSALHEEKHGV